ncbi:MAG TPA: hypothetical protein VKZ69_03445 [Limnochordales bacterium]|nr:hypothetical protein [Limnochordales bacterium]
MVSERAQWVRRWRDQVLGLPNVVGCGWGEKRTRGRKTGQQGMVVFVRRKVPAAALKARERVPAVLDARPTDVIEVGEVRLLAAPLPSPRTARLRPAPPGVSLGHVAVTAGTFGAVVRDAKTGEPLILSNNHVIANQTTGDDGRAAVGDPVLQPGPYDGGTVERDVIGHLLRFVPVVPVAAVPACPVARGAQRVLNAALRLLLPRYQLQLVRLDDAENLVDGAVARPVAPDAITPRILEVGRVQGVAEAEVGMRVKKSGRTSGLTQGEVMALGATLNVALGEGVVARFCDQVVTSPLAQPGDSGSLVLDEGNRAVGLLFAGSPQATVCNRIQNVLAALDVQF